MTSSFPRAMLFGMTLLFAGLSTTASAQGAENPSIAGLFPKAATAIFAGGCFWCTEADFEKLPGVFAAESGYTGGRTVNPTYEQISDGQTGHTEAVRVYYDPKLVSYSQLLEYFWRTIDPTVKDRQFCDSGSQYRSAIFYDNEAQRALVTASRAALLKSGAVPRIETEIAPTARFYPAEAYHQDYYKLNPVRYGLYRSRCGRDERLEAVWGPKKSGKPAQ